MDISPEVAISPDLTSTPNLAVIPDRRSSVLEDHESLQVATKKRDAEQGRKNTPVSSCDKNELQKKRKAADMHAAPGTKRNKPDQVIASLFKNNPQIPQLHRSVVTPIKEEVFSVEAFHQLPLHPFMVSTLEEKLGFTKMTSVQKQTIPHVLNGRDVLVKSQTGSGKTLAYAVPIVHDLQALQPKIQRSDGVHAVVVVPTRELVLQSFETIQKILRPFVWVVPGCLMGGEKKKAEKARIRKGINILICTPGRFLDHVETTSNLELRRVKYLVIDEADRMLDMGFEKDMSKIVAALSEKNHKRQTILLSATLSSGIESLAGMTLIDPVKINLSGDMDIDIKIDDETRETAACKDFSIPQQLKQHFVTVPSKLRLVTLAAFILSKCSCSKHQNKMIVFLSTQDSVEFHHELLLNTICEWEEEKALLLYKLHGDMPQKNRTKVYQEFMETKTGVLLCTDVAARGLHLPATQWIVQYNPPGSPTDYIHRVGRTARVGTQGQSVLFLTPDEVKYVHTLADLKISLQEVPMNDILKTLKTKTPSLVRNRDSKDKRIPTTVEECATALQDVFERYIYAKTEALEVARKAYLTFIRAYATFPSSLKHIFHVKNLHLGHVAKSFGLREAPTSIAGRISKGLSHRAKKDKPRSKIDLPGKKKGNQGTMSEFSSGHVRLNLKAPQRKGKVDKGKLKKKKKVKKHN